MKSLLERALHDPAREFETPAKLVASPRLSVEEKERVLEAWAQDAEALQQAASEGMQGGEQPRLSQIEAARMLLTRDQVKNAEGEAAR